MGHSFRLDMFKIWSTLSGKNSSVSLAKSNIGPKSKSPSDWPNDPFGYVGLNGIPLG